MSDYDYTSTPLYGGYGVGGGLLGGPMGSEAMYDPGLAVDPSLMNYQPPAAPQPAPSDTLTVPQTQPIMTPGQLPTPPAISPPPSSSSNFDPNVWAAQNNHSIGLDDKGNLVPQGPNGPQYGVPGFQYPDQPQINVTDTPLTSTPGQPQTLSPLPPARDVGPPPGMSAPPSDGGPLSMPQLTALAQQAGFSSEKAPTAAAIMMAESSGNPFASNEKGEHSYGLPQINADAWGPIAKTALGNPLQGAKLMFQISKGGEDFHPWTMYKNGEYKKYLSGDYPAFGNARNNVMGGVGSSTAPVDAAASSVPAALAGASSPASAGLGGNTSPITPTGLTGMGGTNMSQLMELVQKASKPNYSKMLANMAAGFLTKGVGGGFAGMAQSMPDNPAKTKLDMLLKLSQLGASSQGMALKNFTALVNAGIPTATAAAASGVSLPGATGSGAAMSDLHGPDLLKSLDGNTASQVQALAEGRMQFPSGYALKTPYWQNMLRNVAQYDPSFDAVNYNARSKTRNDFTSGKSAQAVTSFNTAIGHLGTFLQQADALNNGSYPILNGVKNAYLDNTGDPRVKAFNTTKQAVADELTRAFRLSGGNVADIEGWEKSLNDAGSPDQLHAVVKQAVNLLASRIEAIGDQYKKGMGNTSQPISLLTGHAQQTLLQLPGGSDLIQEMGGNVPSGGSTQAGKPTSPSAPVQMTATGPNGQKLQLVNGRWVPIQ